MVQLAVDVRGCDLTTLHGTCILQVLRSATLINAKKQRYTIILFSVAVASASGFDWTRFGR